MFSVVFVSLAAVYMLTGVIVSCRYYKETMLDIERMPRSGTYKMGEKLGAALFFPVMVFVWPLYFLG